jgi:hypothetical protein
VKILPSKLLESLTLISETKKFMKSMTKKTNNGFKIMRRLTMAHLLIMYSNEFYAVIEEFVSSPILSKDQWLNDTCIGPYYHFLKKVTASYELYSINK